MRSTFVLNQGHSSYMARSSAPSAAAKPSPMPSQAGRPRRVCVQAKIQGMARRLSTPPLGFRFAGREPTFNAASSSSGVALRK